MTYFRRTYAHIGMYALALVLFVTPGLAQQTTGSISGTVTDAGDGGPLMHASAYIAATGQGAAADAEGRYEITPLAAGAYTLLVSYTGYQHQEIEVTLAAGEARVLDIALVAGVELDPIQVTAGRRQEKILDAPASIDVIGAREIEHETAPSTVRALRNVTGLDMVQSGIDRHEVVLRGFNNVFSGATHVLTDYRHAAVASIGVNLHSLMPNMAIDLDRIEVVRGPGSALYGAGVNSGVIHYITKDPFTHPGATISISGGERSLLNFQGRLAGVVGKNIGVKVTGLYATANDFELESCDSALLMEKRFSECPDPLDARQIANDGLERRNNDFKKLTLNGSVEFRLGDNSALIVNGGYADLTSTVLSGIGTLQGDGFGYTYGQIRFTSGNFFAQLYTNRNDSGKSFNYGGDPVVEFSDRYNMQAQYDLQLARGREQLIIGVDIELIRPDTEGTVLGRYEDSDNIDEYGAYLQSTTKITDKLALTLAARGDYNNVAEELQVSPRAAIVFKPAPTSSFRATYNRSFSSPTATSNFLDVVAATLPGTSIKIRGRGTAYGFTWPRNPAFTAIGAPTDLVASSLIPGSEGAPVPVGLPTGDIYGLMYQSLAAIPLSDLAALLAASGIPVDAATAGLLVQLLNPSLTPVSGFSPGVLGTLNLTSFNIDPGPTDLSPIDPLRQTITQSVEVGYKGIVNERVLLAVDAYYAEKENFVGALQMATPFVLVPTLSQDLTRDIAAGIAANPALAGALGLFGLSPEAAAGLLVQLANNAGSLPGPSTPVGVVQPNENNPGVGMTPELMLSYPNFGSISYYGVDASVQVIASQELSLFGNISWISDDFFDNTETGEDDPSQVLALNAPAFKAKFGGSYRHASGLAVHGSGRYIQGFPVNSGPYRGDVDSYFLIDLGVGYDFDGQVDGLRADLGVSNLLDSDHREFIGAPKLGRVAIGRLTYTFGLGR